MGVNMYAIQTYNAYSNKPDVEMFYTGDEVERYLSRKYDIHLSAMERKQINFARVVVHSERVSALINKIL
jgi:hypothetical protein